MEARLNDLQQEAVLHDAGPLLVLAGPGTGKTRILIERVRRMIQEGIPPEQIMLVTFTTKAADEIKHRLIKDLGNDILEHLNAGTLHSKALQIMIANERKHNRRIPEVADPAECFDYFKRAKDEVGAAYPGWSLLDLWALMMRAKSSEARGNGTLPYAVQTLVRRYDQILESERKWDLADLIAKGLQVLQTEADIALTFKAIRYLMVDEFQDTSALEYQFLKAMLADNPNFMMVAAAAQSIYAWRGADFAALQTQVRKDQPDLKTLILRENYRCGQHIINAAGAMTPEEDEVRLFGNRGSGRVAWKELPDDFAEANFIAIAIKTLEGLGVNLPDIAVLFRARNQAGPIEQALVAQTIPYKLYSENKKFYERDEIQEMAAYIQAIKAFQDYNTGAVDSPRMNGSIDRIINTPPRGIGPRSIKLIREDAPEITVTSLARAIGRADLRPQVREAAFDLFTTLNAFAELKIEKPAELIDRILADTPWIKSLQDHLEGRQAIHRLQSFRETALRHPNLEAFLQDMATKVTFRMDAEGVALSTIHGAKGLEWPVVFVVGFADGILPASQAIRSAGQGDPVEERHVAHVAFSRARDLLVISWYRHKLLNNGRAKPLTRSRFVGLIPKEVWHEYCAEDLQFAGGPDSPQGHNASEREALEDFIGL